MQDDVEGLITERDYLRKVAVTGKSSKEMSCGALMTPTTKIIDIEPHDTVAKVRNSTRMQRNITSHLPRAWHKHAFCALTNWHDACIRVMPGSAPRAPVPQANFMTASCTPCRVP